MFNVSPGVATAFVILIVGLLYVYNSRYEQGFNEGQEEGEFDGYWEGVTDARGWMQNDAEHLQAQYERVYEALDFAYELLTDDVIDEVDRKAFISEARNALYGDPLPVKHEAEFKPHDRVRDVEGYAIGTVQSVKLVGDEFQVTVQWDDTRMYELVREDDVELVRDVVLA